MGCPALCARQHQRDRKCAGHAAFRSARFPRARRTLEAAPRAVRPRGTAKRLAGSSDGLGTAPGSQRPAWRRPASSFHLSPRACAGPWAPHKVPPPYPVLPCFINWIARTYQLPRPGELISACATSVVAAERRNLWHDLISARRPTRRLCGLLRLPPPPPFSFAAGGATAFSRMGRENAAL